MTEGPHRIPEGIVGLEKRPKKATRVTELLDIPIAPVLIELLAGEILVLCNQDWSMIKFYFKTRCVKHEKN